MNDLIKEIKNLKKSNVGQIVNKRLAEFEALGKKHAGEIFKELCFCVLTANSTAERCIKVQEAAGDSFLKLSEKQLAEMLKKLGARFHTKRAGYIAEARKHLKNLNFSDSKQDREWLVENVKGIGMKEASHFLRNIGFTDVAIIDFHIIDVLAKHELIKKPKSKALTKKQYLEIEEILRKLAKKAGLNLAELDLYLWYMETGKILK